MSKKKNPDAISLHIIDLIHQRSLAFDYGREQSEMLEVAIEALDFINKNFNRMVHPNNSFLMDEIAGEALKQIEDMKKKSNEQIQK